eukprot:4219593-Prymnesium_polylepis.1
MPLLRKSRHHPPGAAGQVGVLRLPFTVAHRGADVRHRVALVLCDSVTWSWRAIWGGRCV